MGKEHTVEVVDSVETHEPQKTDTKKNGKSYGHDFITSFFPFILVFSRIKNSPVIRCI